MGSVADFRSKFVMLKDCVDQMHRGEMVARQAIITCENLFESLIHDAIMLAAVGEQESKRVADIMLFEGVNVLSKALEAYETALGLAEEDRKRIFITERMQPKALSRDQEAYHAVWVNTKSLLKANTDIRTKRREARWEAGQRWVAQGFDFMTLLEAFRMRREEIQEYKSTSDICFEMKLQNELGL